MIVFEEPPVGWVSEVPVDPDEVPGWARAVEEGEVDLGPVDQLAFAGFLDEQERVEATGGVDDLDADGVLAAVAGSQRSVNLTEARLLFLAARWADLNAVLPFAGLPPVRGGQRLVQVGGVGTPEVSEFAAAELGAVLGISTFSGRLLVADALDLRHRLPRLWHRLQTGGIRIWVARRIATRTRHLTAHAAGLVDAGLCQVAGRLVGVRLEQVLDAAILKADPDAAQQAADAAAGQQGVWLGRHHDHGIATLVGKAPAPDLHRVDVSLDELARALTVLGDTDTHDIRRARALALLADPEAALDTMRRAHETHTTTNSDGPGDSGDADADADAEPEVAGEPSVGPHGGTDPRRRLGDLGDAVLYVHVTDRTVADTLTGTPGGVARVADVGPVLLRQVADWLGHRHVTVKPVLDIPGIQAIDRYEFTPTMGEALRIISPAGYFPYSTNLTGNGDNEHPDPYLPPDDGGPPGQTGLHNGAWTPRFPHRIKTHSGWTVHQLRPGAWLWRTPHAHHYLVDEHGTTKLGPL